MDTPQIMDYFSYGHLPEHLQVVSEPFARVAAEMYVRLGDTEECHVGLRKLLEAKDCMVRAAVTQEVLRSPVGRDEAEQENLS